MVQRSLTLPIAPDHLWETLTDPDRAAGWLGGRVDWQLVPGAPVRYRGDDGERRDGTVRDVEPGRSLRWTWWPEGDEGRATDVTWELEPEGDGTEFTVTEAPADAAPSACHAGGGETAWTWSTPDDRWLALWVEVAAVVAARR